MNDLYQPTNTPDAGAAAASANSGFDFFGFFANFNLGQTLVYVNYIALLWTIVFTCFFIYNFLYFHIRNGWGELERERPAVDSLRKARRFWITYLIAWCFLLVFWLNPGNVPALWGWLALVVYFVKIVLLDASVLPIYSGMLGSLAAIFGAPLTEIPEKLAPSVQNTAQGIADLASPSKDSAPAK